jgi:hypothetical protein
MRMIDLLSDSQDVVQYFFATHCCDAFVNKLIASHVRTGCQIVETMILVALNKWSTNVHYFHRTKQLSAA